MQNAVVTQSGQLWNVELTAIPPIFSQYWRMMLQRKMTGPMSREAQTLCFAQDLLIQGRISGGMRCLTQRLKGLEQMAGGGHFTLAQKQELVPTDSALMTSPAESMQASRLHGRGASVGSGIGNRSQKERGQDEGRSWRSPSRGPREQGQG